MKIKVSNVWLIMILSTILPILLIVFYAIGQELFTGQKFTGKDFMITPAFAIVIAISHSTIFLTLIYLLRKQGHHLDKIGWKKLTMQNTIQEIGIGVLLSFAIYLFKELALDSLSAILAGQTPTFHSLFNFQFKKEDVSLMIIAFIFPFVEESVFRGYPYFKWKQEKPTWVIAMITSLVFGLMHTLGDGRDLLSGINAAILGGIYFLIFYWRKNLYASTAAHSFYNFMVVLT